MQKAKKERGEPRDWLKSQSLGPLFDLDCQPVLLDGLAQTVEKDTVVQSDAGVAQSAQSSDSMAEDLPPAASLPVSPSIGIMPDIEHASPVSNTGVHSTFFDSLFRL